MSMSLPVSGPCLPEEQQIAFGNGIQHSRCIELFLNGVLGLPFLAGNLDDSLWPKLVLKFAAGTLQGGWLN